MYSLITAILIATAMLVAAEDPYTPVRFKTCPSKFEVVSVDAIGCPLVSNKCLFKHDTRPRIRIGFKPDRVVEKLSTTVRAKLEGTFVSFHLDNADACQGQNISCPLQPGQLYYYSQEVKIVREYPAVDVLVNWLLNDPDQPKSEYFDDRDQRIKSDLCVIFRAIVQKNN